MLKINVAVHKNGAMDVDHDSKESSQQQHELWSHPYNVNITWVSSLVKHNQMSKSPFYVHISLLIDVYEWLWRCIICQTVTMSCMFPSHSYWAVRCTVPTGMMAEQQPADDGGGLGDSLSVCIEHRLIGFCLIIDRASTQCSDGREVILTGRSTARGGAAFCHHGDLGAEVEAVACHRRLLVLGVSPQKSLHVPSPPLPFDLRLDLESVCMRSVKYLYFSQIIFAREGF